MRKAAETGVPAALPEEEIGSEGILQNEQPELLSLEITRVMRRLAVALTFVAALGVGGSQSEASTGKKGGVVMKLLSDVSEDPETKIPLRMDDLKLLLEVFHAKDVDIKRSEGIAGSVEKENEGSERKFNELSVKFSVENPVMKEVILKAYFERNQVSYKLIVEKDDGSVEVFDMDDFSDGFYNILFLTNGVLQIARQQDETDMRSESYIAGIFKSGDKHRYYELEGKVTNQDIINAFYHMAKGNHEKAWSWMREIGLDPHYLVANREEAFQISRKDPERAVMIPIHKLKGEWDLKTAILFAGKPMSEQQGSIFVNGIN